MKCEHKQFEAKVHVERREKDPPEHVAHVAINCVGCGVAMMFDGSRSGITPDKTTMVIAIDPADRPSVDQNGKAPKPQKSNLILPPSARGEKPQIHL